MTDVSVTGTQGGLTSGWATNATPPTAADQSLGKDAFLKLLVAQLRYQDPSSPTDSSQMMAQTAQYSMVEKLSDLLVTNQSSSAIALVGKEVVWDNALGVEQSGVVTGVSISGGKAVLEVGDESVSLESVMKVRSPSADTTTGTLSSGTTGSTTGGTTPTTDSGA